LARWRLDLAGTQLRLLTAGRPRARDGPEDVEEHPSHGGGGVDPPVEHDQIDATLLEEPGELDQVLQRAAEPVEI
jgi:hypothetical protein